MTTRRARIAARIYHGNPSMTVAPRHHDDARRRWQTSRVAPFDYTGDPDRIVVDLSGAHIWDAFSVAALDALNTKYATAASRCRSSVSTRPAPASTKTWPANSALAPNHRQARCGNDRTAHADRRSRRASRTEHPHHPSLRGSRPRRAVGTQRRRFRLYTEVDLDRLRVIKRMKPLGSTVDEMRDLLTTLESCTGWSSVLLRLVRPVMPALVVSRWVCGVPRLRYAGARQ